MFAANIVFEKKTEDVEHRSVVRVQVDLTQCINEVVLESQHPHKIVNLLFT